MERARQFGQYQIGTAQMLGECRQNDSDDIGDADLTHVALANDHMTSPGSGLASIVRQHTWEDG